MSFVGVAMRKRWQILQLTAMGLQRDPETFQARSKETLAEADRTLLEQPEVAEAYIAGLREAFRSGTSGANRDAQLYAKPWGFRLEEIAAEVHLWHGEEDLKVPVSAGRAVAGAIPGRSATFFKGEAHLTVPHNQIAEILNALIA